MRRAGVALAVILGLLAARPAGWASYARWPVMPVNYEINPRNLYLSEDAAEAALQRAAAIWWQQSNALVSTNYLGRTTDTAATLDYRNIVLFRSTGQVGGPFASTYWWHNGTYIFDADIVIWDSAYHYYSGTSGCTGSGVYVEDIVGHEFGHLFGLSHSGDGSATMYPYAAYCTQAWRTLAQDDITGIETIYPNPGPYNYPPHPTVMGPPNGTTVPAGTAVELTGYASDVEDGDLTPSMIWRSSLAGDVGTGSPVTVTLPSGQHAVTVSATDSGGVAVTSAPIYVTVVAPFPPVTVTITAPLEGAKVAHNHDYTIKAAATGGPIQRVEFFVNDTLTCSDLTAAYSCKWRVPAPIGVSYTLRAMAWGIDGGAGMSPDVHVASK